MKKITKDNRTIKTIKQIMESCPETRGFDLLVWQEYINRIGYGERSLLEVTKLIIAGKVYGPNYFERFCRKTREFYPELCIDKERRKQLQTEIQNQFA